MVNTVYMWFYITEHENIKIINKFKSFNGYSLPVGCGTSVGIEVNSYGDH